MQGTPSIVVVNSEGAKETGKISPPKTRRYNSPKKCQIPPAICTDFSKIDPAFAHIKRSSFSAFESWQLHNIKNEE
jgi:hypothetical protein